MKKRTYNFLGLFNTRVDLRNISRLIIVDFLNLVFAHNLEALFGRKFALPKAGRCPSPRHFLCELNFDFDFRFSIFRFGMKCGGKQKFYFFISGKKVFSLNGGEGQRKESFLFRGEIGKNAAAGGNKRGNP